jgi:formate dehydrogenase major subunit
MAECHPVGFQWVMEAKKRGATIIHVDPRFTRTSAVADVYVPLRAGTDIAFLGGIIRYILENNRYFHDYVVNYTNAAAIISEDFRDTEDLDGFFSGWDTEKNQYNPKSWSYEGSDATPAAGAHEQLTGEPRSERAQSRPKHRDESLQHPRCVFQILKRHYARYTPEMVEGVCGVPPDLFLKVAEALCNNSGRDRTSAFCYAVGWTQHTTGVQIIRTASIVQQLLGNMGRPGGGIMALRGHASIQGSTDVPTLYNVLPGYLAMPKAKNDQTFQQYLENNEAHGGWWTQFPKYMISLLKAWYGSHATYETDWCYDYLPRLTGDHSHMTTYAAMADGVVKGYMIMGENPVVGSMNGGFQRSAVSKLEWLVVRDFQLIETAEFWKTERPEDIATEVFFFPAAAHTEKDGSFTNTQRLLQWHHKAVEPPGDCRSELDFIYDLGVRLQAIYKDSTDPKDRPIQQLTWDAATAEDVLREVNGFTVTDRKELSGYSDLKDDGSTACGCWIYSGCYKDGTNQTARRKPGQDQNWVAPEWGWAWPLNRRLLYNRASADPEGRPWSDRKKYVWWDEAQQKWTGFDVPDFIADRPPSYRPPENAQGLATISGIDPFIMNADGKSWLYAPQGLQDGPMPTHYEAQEGPVPNALYGQQCNPARMEWIRRENPYHRPWNDPAYPYLVTTYRLTEHHTAGGMSRWLRWLAELQPEMFCEVSPELAAEKNLVNGGWATISTARSEIEARVLVTRRLRPVRMRGRLVHQIGLPYHWGSKGLVRGDSANDLIAFTADPNVSIQESKAFTANIVPGRKPSAHRAMRPSAEAEGESRDLPPARLRKPGKHGVVTSRSMSGEET